MTNKTIQHIFTIFILSLIPLFIAFQAQAGLIVGNVITDTKTELRVAWFGKGMFDDGIDNDSLSVAAPVNWLVPTVTLNYLGGGDGWSGILSAVHTARPHFESVDGGIFNAPITFNVVPDDIVEYKGSLRKRLSHVDHINEYFFSYSYNVKTGLFVANLRGVHIPEPSLLAIFTIGMIGLASRRFKKKS